LNTNVGASHKYVKTRFRGDALKPALERDYRTVHRASRRRQNQGWTANSRWSATTSNVADVAVLRDRGADAPKLPR